MSASNVDIAKHALEWVCSGAGLAPTANFYSPRFVDHVNDREFHGVAGTEASVAIYRALVPDLRITVVEQVAADDRVVSRYVVTGTSYGRQVRFQGITVSHLEHGRIVEDWTVTDTLGFMRQLGLIRAVLVAIRGFRALAEHSACRFHPGSDPSSK